MEKIKENMMSVILLLILIERNYSHFRLLDILVILSVIFVLVTPADFYSRIWKSINSMRQQDDRKQK